jgi:hypothetical protein
VQETKMANTHTSVFHSTGHIKLVISSYFAIMELISAESVALSFNLIRPTVKAFLSNIHVEIVRSFSPMPEALFAPNLEHRCQYSNTFKMCRTTYAELDNRFVPALLLDRGLLAGGSATLALLPRMSSSCLMKSQLTHLSSTFSLVALLAPDLQHTCQYGDILRRLSRHTLYSTGACFQLCFRTAFR